MSVTTWKAFFFTLSAVCSTAYIPVKTENSAFTVANHQTKPTKHGCDDIVWEYFFFHRGGSRLDDIEWLYQQWLDPIRECKSGLNLPLKSFLFCGHIQHFSFSESLLPKSWCSYCCLLKLMDDTQLFCCLFFLNAVRDGLL